MQCVRLTGARRQRILMPMLEAGPDCFDHAAHSVATHGTLHTHPDHTDDTADDHGNVSAAHTKAGPGDDREVETKLRSDVGRAASRDGDQKIADQASDDSKTGVETKGHSARGRLQLRDIETLCDPEASHVIPLPFLVGLWYRIQVFIAPAGRFAFCGKRSRLRVQDHLLGECLQLFHFE